MVHLLNYDYSSHFTKAFHQYPIFTSFSKVNRNVRFNLKACFDASNGNSNGDDNRVVLKEKRKGISVIDERCNATNVEHRSQGGSHNKPFCFHDHQFSQKLVVAVDVDEGVCFYVCIC